MYCKQCGKFLAGNENFCSNCGSKVEAPEAPVKEQETSKIEKEQENIKIISPMDDIVWDVKEFPTSTPRKTEDAKIKWRSEDMFLHKEVNKEPVDIMSEADIEAPQETEMPKEEPSIEIPDIFDSNRTVVTRNTAAIEPDYLEDDSVVEISQPSPSSIVFEVTQTEEEGIKVEKVVVDEPELTSVIADEIEEPVKEVADEITEEVEKEIEIPEPPKVEEEKTLFDEIAPEAVATLEGARLNEEKKQIDKFYTFNRKKEEFQKLLDKEYERIERKCEPGGFEEDIAGFMDVQTGTGVEGTTQLEEMVKARELFFDDPFYVPQEEEADSEPEEAENEGIPAEELDSVKVVFEPETDESLADSFMEGEQQKEEEPEAPIEETVQEQETPSQEEEIAAEAEVEESEEPEEPTQVIIEPSENKKEENKETTEELAKEFFDGADEEPPKMGKGSKIAIWILSIIIVLVVALLAIRIAMPDTYLSRQMDSIADKAITFVKGIGGSDETTTEENREELVEDKSGLIQLQIDKNYKNNIATIKYNEELKYDADKTYSLADLKDAKDIQTNLWYKEDSGKAYYYDEEIVGAIIAFESERTALMNDKDPKVYDIVEKDSALDKTLREEAQNPQTENFETLEIGEIKVAGNAYYVWVSETKDGKTENKVYEIKENDKKLVITGVSEA